jgi:hypothetical protein
MLQMISLVVTAYNSVHLLLACGARMMYSRPRVLHIVGSTFDWRSLPQKEDDFPLSFAKDDAAAGLSAMRSANAMTAG